MKLRIEITQRYRGFDFKVVKVRSFDFRKISVADTKQLIIDAFYDGLKVMLQALEKSKLGKAKNV